MALRAANVSDVPKLDQVQENAALALCSSRLITQCVNIEGSDDTKRGFKFGKFVVMGHRGSGMNMLQSCDRRMKSVKENSILSFISASKLPLDFIEFDVQLFINLFSCCHVCGRVCWPGSLDFVSFLVRFSTLSLSKIARRWLHFGDLECGFLTFVQVTKDDCPVIFHDNFILTEHKGELIEKRVTDLTLDEFRSYGPQDEVGSEGKSLFKKTKDGRIFEWKVEEDAPFCTLQEVFQRIDDTMGFNIELKFDDNIIYKEEELKHILQVILQERPVMFSSFQPDAALLMRKLQSTYPVFFLTNGGSETYTDVRRNSLDEAIKVCTEGGLQGIVSEVKAVFRNPGAVTIIKESKLSLITYGQLNNVPEVVHMQHLMGIEGVIVDLVHEITEAVSHFVDAAKDGEGSGLFAEEGKIQVKTKPRFSSEELSFLMKLISEFIQS
ncbi:glycerophosphodiester phosphodiesterase GDPD1 [Populus alba x Populus x berolinensis]|uniref:glycerophosphodiester phosphodiesterase n=1 Tax=Populus alba x Populus x berolinensis TaxID=444605 RepID=A0AAD6RJP1_9ROSI|nr:glycerophosphodiester phosphodiesterase GDPD1 [Populus alba x Populus x berolinensis]